jgi:hypothetical protein
MQYLIRRTSLTLQPGMPRLDQVPTEKEIVPEGAEKQYADKRRSRRAKIARALRVRPSEPKDDHFEDLPVSINASKEGILFKTRQATYYPGMRVFVTFPYSSPHDPMNCEYVAQVVRVDKLPNGRFGVAVNLLMTVNYTPGKQGSTNRT